MTAKGALAIDGGQPVRAAMLPYGRHRVDQADVDAVVRALRSDWLTTGPAVDEFEAAFAKAVGAPHAVALSSGTAALHAAAFAAGIGAGDEAVTTPLTFAATANCVLYLGATVAFADVRPDTLNLDSTRVEACLTPRTKAVITVDYTGEPSDLDELESLCSRRGLTLIEDASHALGAVYRGRPVGSVARLTTFSLHPVKHITTGEGGLVTTDDATLAARGWRHRASPLERVDTADGKTDLRIGGRGKLVLRQNDADLVTYALQQKLIPSRPELDRVFVNVDA